MTLGGHIHWMNWVSSAQASNTRSRGASKTRTRRRVLSSSTADTAFLLRWFRSGWFRNCTSEEGVELVELLLPEAAIELDPVGGFAHALATQGAAAPLRLGAA